MNASIINGSPIMVCRRPAWLTTATAGLSPDSRSTHTNDTITSMREKVIPLLWLLAFAIIIGASMGALTAVAHAQPPPPPDPCLWVTGTPPPPPSQCAVLHVPGFPMPVFNLGIFPNSPPP